MQIGSDKQERQGFRTRRGNRLLIPSLKSRDINSAEFEQQKCRENTLEKEQKGNGPKGH